MARHCVSAGVRWGGEEGDQANVSSALRGSRREKSREKQVKQCYQGKKDTKLLEELIKTGDKITPNKSSLCVAGPVLVHISRKSSPNAHVL